MLYIKYLIVFIGIILPFLGTALGSAMVFFLKKELSPKINTLFLGLASGVMLAASIWSLIIPSIELTDWKILSFVPCVIGLILGLIFMILIERFIAKLNNKNKESKSNKLLLTSVTLHNIPEGLSVGAAFALALNGNFYLLIASAFVFTIGIAIQNFPEGAIISLPLRANGMKRGKAFLCGALSGIVEPIASFITILLTKTVVFFLPYLLSFAAGAMIYVVIENLIPEMQENKSKIGVIGCFIGFIIMMSLDVALG